MKLPFKFLILLLSFLLFVLTNKKVSGIQEENYFPPDSVKKVYYAIEISGVVCGYTESTESETVQNGEKVIKQELNIFLMLSLLGSEFNTEMNLQSLLDPVTQKYNYLNVNINQGVTKRNFEVTIKNNTALINSSLKSEPTKIELNPETLIGQDETFVRLKKDFLVSNKSEVSYDIFEALEESVQNSSFKKTGEEKIELVGRTYNTITIEQTNNKTGLKIKYWMAPDIDDFVKFEVLNRKVYLADHKVVDRIKVANMDESIFNKTNVSISDVPSISFMKLKAEIEPIGINLSPDHLNIPGQKFTGTVKENYIDGIFEIEYKKYSGDNAPPFPAEYKNNEQFKKYLEPGRMIESDDTVLIAKAKEITLGSENSWEAATRLSKWVAENISYAIPGGGNARNTYDIRAGECGSHSMLLTAFCRAVGIPARVVWGAMYVPNRGGGFGQHAWNEIYMGEAGWIPVDATAFEIDFVDAGHIRIAEVQSLSSMFNGKKFEVLDYKLKENSETEKVEKSKLELYLGKYTHLEAERTFEVIEKDGNLSVNIPGQMILPFNKEDEQNRWYCKLANRIYIKFNIDENGKANQMLFHEIITMPKKAQDVNVNENVPDKLKPYLGKYLFAARNAEFSVDYIDNTLAVFDPTENRTIKLLPPGEDGGWIDEYKKNTVYFDKDEKGNVTTLKADVANKFERGELAATIIENIIKSNSIQAGLKKYQELRNNPDKEIIFTEKSINALGYKLINENRIEDAIEILKLNIDAYPESFNVYDSIGEAYMKNSRNDLAIENYKKSLELNPENNNAIQMLEKLGVKMQ